MPLGPSRTTMMELFSGNSLRLLVVASHMFVRVLNICTVGHCRLKKSVNRDLLHPDRHSRKKETEALILCGCVQAILGINKFMWNPQNGCEEH